MATLAGKKIKDTYKDLLQISNSNSGIDSSLKTVSDGEGTDSLLQLSSSAVNISSAGALHYAGTPITATGSELNLLDGVTATTAEINYIDGVTSNIQTQLNSKLSSHPNISAASSSNNSGAVFIQDITLDSNGHITGLGTATASTLTTEAVEDIVGAMFTSNTDTRIATSYDDNNAKIDLAVNDMTIGNQVEAVQDIIGAMVDGGTETRIAVTYDDANAKFNFIVDDMTADTNTQLSNAQVRTAVEAATDSNVFTNADHSKLNAIEAGATADQTDEEIQDIVGAMFTSTNTETGITATYQDATGDIDLVVGTLNQDTTGNADTATKIASITNSNIVQLTDTQTLTNKTLASPTFTGDINFTDASTPILTITDTTNTAQLRLFATDTTTDIGSLSAHKVNFRYNNDIRLQLEDTKFMVNAGSDDMDFTVKDASGLQALHVDAGDGDVNIRTLDVSGDADIDGTLETDALTIGGVTSVPFEAADHSKLDGIAASANNYVLPLKDEDNMASNSSTHVSSQQSIKAYVDAEVAGVVDSSPAALNTLNELAAALGDDANFSTTTSTSLGNRLRVDTASQGLTGTQQANAITNLGITATKAELNILDGVTATAAELNIMDGVTATTAELNYTDGVTSSIQTQLDATLDTAGTGIDISSTTVSVDVSDFMSNGVNNYVLTATGTDAFRGEGNLTFDGSTLAVTGAITGSSTLNVTGVTTLQNHLELGDSDKIKLGASADLEIYHDGTNSVINNTQTGALQIYNNVDNGMIELLTDNGSGGTQVFLRADGANNMVRMPVDGVKFTLGDASDLQLYHDGSNNYLRNNTTDQDFSILVNDGGSTITAMKIDASEIGRIKLPNDDQQLTIGAGQDLRFYHTSDTSNIVNFTGGLNIQNAGAGSTIIKNTSENQDIFLQVNDGGSTINAIRIDASDNARVKLANDNQKLSIGASNDIEIFHDGTDTYVQNYTGDFYIRNNTDDKDIILQCDDASGGVTAYITLDGSAGTVNIAKSTSFAASTNYPDSIGATFGDSGDLQIFHNGSYGNITNGTGNLYIDNTTDNADMYFRVDDAGTLFTAMRIDGSEIGNVHLPNDGQNLYIGANNDIRLVHLSGTNYMYTYNGPLYVGAVSTDQDVFIRGNDGGASINAVQFDMSDAGTAIFNHDIRIMDNSRYFMGTSNDFQMMHDGTNSHIENLTGNLYITEHKDDGDIIFRCDDGSGGVTPYLTLDGSASRVVVGAVDLSIPVAKKLYFGGGDHTYISEDADDRLRFFVGGDEFMRFTQQDAGGEIFGIYQDVYIPDAKTMHFGAGNDLKIYHDGSNNYIKSNTSDQDLFIQVNDGGSNKTAIQIDASDNGSLYLPNDNQKIHLGAGFDLRLWHDGSNSIMYAYGTGSLYIGTTVDDADVVLVGDDGSGGTTAYLTLDGSAGTVNIDKEIHLSTHLDMGDGDRIKLGDSDDLQIVHDSNINFIHSTISDRDIYFRVNDGGSSVDAIIIDASDVGAVKLPNDNQYLYIGAGNDIYFGHGGTNSIWGNNTGTLQIRNHTSDADMFLSVNDGGSHIHAVQIDASDGGTAIFNHDVKVNDNGKLKAGDGNDFTIHHDGTNSYINNSTGHIYFTTEADDKNLVFRTDDGSGGVANYLIMNGGSSIITAHKNMRFDDSIKSMYGDSSDLQVYHNGTNSFGADNYTGHLIFQNRADDSDIIFKTDDGSGGVATYLTLDGSASTINVAKTMDFGDGADNIRVRLGAGQDLQLGHDGTNSFISNSTGNLDIKNFGDNTDIILYSDDGGGGVTAYLTLDGSVTKTIFNQDAALSATKKLFLDGGGHSYLHENADDSVYMVVGGQNIMRFYETSSVGYAYAPDNFYVGVGNGIDFTMRHDGSNSYLKNETGNLVIRGRDDGYVTIDSADGTESIVCDLKSEVKIKHAGTTVFETNSSGFQLPATKKLYFDGGNNTYITETASDLVDMYVGGTLMMRFEESGTDSVFTNDNVHLAVGVHKDLRIYHNSSSSNNNIENHSGSLYITNEVDDADIIFRSDDGSGGVEAYLTLDGSSKESYFSTKLGIGTTNPGELLHIVSSSGDARILLDAPNGSDTEIKFFNAGSAVYTIGHDDGTGNFVLGSTNVDTPLLSVSNTGVLYIKTGGSDYTPGIVFLGGSNTAGSNAHENAHIAYYDNSGTGTMLFEGKRGAMNWAFNDSDETLFLMSSGGTLHCEADVVAYSTSVNSDRKLKENINPIPYGLKEVLQMNPVEYDWKEKRDKAHDIGVIAQEIEEIIPEVVQENKDLNSDKMIKSVDYSKMVSVLIKAVQEQQVQIDELKTKLGE